MIYFDNAATGGFKPNTVIESAENAIKYLMVNPGRSSHKRALIASEFVYRTRKKLAETFNNRHPERVIFTKNCTEALNMAIFGLFKENSEIISTVTEHNSVLRPLYALMRKCNVKVRFVTPKSNKITEEDILPLVNENTSLVVVNAVSNVTGQKNEFEEIGKKLRCPYVVDCAQAAGHIKIDMSECGISAIAVAAHKGLYAIGGSGALIFRETDIKPLTFGGSGTESFQEVPSCYPELLESGSLNLPAICSIYDGVCFAEENLEISQKRLLSETDYIIRELKKIGVQVFSAKNQFGIVAFRLATPSVYVAETLSEKYDIAVRGGFHCAPLMHKFLNTQEDGLIRVSLASQNSEREIDYFLKAVFELTEQGF